jgi:hypothetical protein
MIILRDGSGTKSGSSEAFGLMLYPSPLAAKAKAQKARARGSPTCLIGLGGFSGFVLFVIAIAISCLGWECRVRGGRRNCSSTVFEVDWTELD